MGEYIVGNEPIQILVISLFTTFIILILIHSQTKFTYFDWSNTRLDNVTKMTLYSVANPDNYSKAIFIYKNLQVASKSLNITDFELFQKLRTSQFISENCTMFEQIKQDEPTFYAFSCIFYGNKYFYIQQPYTSFSKLDAFVKENCTLGEEYRGWQAGLQKEYFCQYGTIKMKQDASYL